jgi:hypothetical protein
VCIYWGAPAVFVSIFWVVDDIDVAVGLAAGQVSPYGSLSLWKW